MKNRKKEVLLITLIIIILVIIIFLSITYIYQKKKPSTTNDLYGIWENYRQEIVNDNIITYALDTNVGYINIIDDINMSICEYGEEKANCQKVTYTKNNDNINITNSTVFISGEYKITFDNDIMILEKQESNQKVVIKSYFRKALG